MNVTFMIGNGFDLNLGLKTGYQDFAKEYVKQKDTDSEAIVKFKSYLNDHFIGVNWADLELEFGKYSLKVDSIDEYDECFDDIVENLSKYLLLQEKIFSENLEKKKIGEPYNKVYLFDIIENFIKTHYSSLNDGKPLKITVLSFNYTSSIEKCFSKFTTNKWDSKVTFEHKYVHGALGNTLLFGLNDVSQIKNVKLYSTVEDAAYLIKPIANRMTEVDRSARLLEILRRSNVIYTYGVSFGETDKTWWKDILCGIDFEKNHRIFMSVFDNDIKQSASPRSRIPKQLEIIKSVYEKSDLIVHGSGSHNIDVGINESVFDCLRDLNVSLENAEEKVVSPF